MTDVTSAAFATEVMRRILGAPGAEEDGVDRLKQVGMMMLVYNLQLRGVDATTSRIEQLSGASRRAIYDLARSLEAKGLLVTTSITNRHNRGRVFKYVIPDPLLDPLSLEVTPVSAGRKRRR